MKKLSAFAVVLLMATFVFNQSFAKADKKDEQTIEQQDITDYMKSTGIIKDIISQDGKVTLTVETEEKEPQITFLTITEDALIFNSGTTQAVQKDSFKKGQRIDAYYDKNKPMLTIYPPQISPELVIVNDEKNVGSVKVSKFDKQLLSLDNELRLNIGKETVIVNEKGEKVRQQDLIGKELVVFYTFTTRSIPAQTTPNKIIALDSIEQEQEPSNFMKSSGTIKNVVSKNEKVTLTVESDEKEPQTTIFTITEDTLVFNSGTTKAIQKKSFKKGQRIDAFYDKNKPMILIYPPQISPELVIVQDEKKAGAVKVSKFDDQFVSLDNELKLNIGKNTILVNEKGQKVKQQDLVGKELVVFFTNTTRSIPAQTTPSKIVAINYLSPEMKEVQKIIEKDSFIQNKTKMIPLQKVAEQLGYEVSTHPVRNSISLSLGNSSINVMVGEKTYHYNKSLRQFTEKPVLKKKTLYVSEEILEILIQR